MRRRPFPHCAVPGCAATLAPNALMCLAHWRKVPKALHRELFEGLHAWEAAGRPSPIFLATLRAAVEKAQGVNDPLQLPLSL